MQEIELKFFISDNKLNSLKKRVAIKSAIEQTLCAYYFDTPERLLAKHGIALRIRQENDQWVQTLKTAGDGISARLEHNHILDTEMYQNAQNNASLQPDLTIYQNTEFADILYTLGFDKITLNPPNNQPLICQYYTDIKRISRNIEKENNCIEVAFDTGNVHCDLFDQPQHAPIKEIEFELINGKLDFLFDTAYTWCKRYQLSLSTITKSEWGGLLLAKRSYPLASKANLKQLYYGDVKKAKNISQAQFIRGSIHHCLLQILPNASAIASGKFDGTHIHQIRVGIRRLRTLLKSCAKFSNQLKPEWQTTLKSAFQQLGKYRDWDILQNQTQPMLEQMGSPEINWQIELTQTPEQIVQTTELQLTFIELIALTLSDIELSAIDKETSSISAKKRLAKIINKEFKKALIEAKNFTNLEPEQQHDLRKRLKRIRYLSEFATPLFNKKHCKRFLKHIKHIQNLLGNYTDNLVAIELYQQQTQHDPNALFAVGWFQAQHEPLKQICAENLQTLKDIKIFWSSKS